MTRPQLLAFMRAHRMAVQASVSPDGAPQAAVVGAAVTDDFEIVFDTIDSTRKVACLRHNPAIAFVFGGSANAEEQTLQYEGVADEPRGAELERIMQAYFVEFPDGRARQAWPGLIYIRVRPLWIRYSDFGRTPPLVVELTADGLMRL